MQNTIIGVYDDIAQAQAAQDELVAAGFARERVQLNPHADSIGTTGTSSTSASTSGTSQSDSGGIGGFFRGLFGMDEESETRSGSEYDMYAEAARRGSCVLTVDADSDDELDRAEAILQRHNPVDIDQRSESWRSEGWTGYDASAPAYSADEMQAERARYASTGSTARTTDDTTENQRIPVVEEQLKVGKRTVNRGGVRVVRRTSEKPVHESVDLRKETVSVNRQPVDKPASEADLAAFEEGTIEMRETSEEAVVSKEARVVEEVEIGKQVSHETADIDEKLRRTDVDVQRMDTAAGRGDYADTVQAADDADFRTHWQNAYGTSGGRYEDYDAAYRYGSSADERVRNARWEDVEPQMRSDWEAHHPESTWERVKDAVRYGAQRHSRM
ncbi:MAG TPA: YsnF/AvaK domain-containing protein [Noviherbaspirillum sp.]